MSQSSNAFYFPTLKENDISQIYHFDKLVAYINYLNKYYKEKLGFDIPCFQKFTVAFLLLDVFEGKTLEHRKKQVIRFYDWVAHNLDHITDFDDCKKYCQQFVEFEADQTGFNVNELLEQEHLDEFTHLLWNNLEAERALRE